MRLYLINPSNPLVCMVNVKENRWNRYRVRKPLSLMVLAGLTPPAWEISILDESRRVMNYKKEASPDRLTCGQGRKIVGTVDRVKVAQSPQFTIKYGIESYYVEEGLGRKIGAARDGRHLRVEVALRSDGKGTIVKLMMGKAVFR